MGDVFPKNIDGGFESIGHYEDSMKDFTRVLDYLDRTENISEERKELYHHHLDEIGMDGVFELARNTNELFKELGINSYKLQQIEHGRKGGLIGGRKGGQITYERGIGIHGRTPEEMSEHGRKGGLIGGRKANEAQGFHLWSLEEIAELGELKYEQGLTWKDTADEFNRRHGTDYTSDSLNASYHRNKHLLTDEEE